MSEYPFTTIVAFYAAAFAANYYLKWWLATKHPNAYESLKRVEDDRKRGMANAAVKSAQVGFQLYKFFRK
jgi:hypothetical protein